MWVPCCFGVALLIFLLVFDLRVLSSNEALYMAVCGCDFCFWLRYPRLDVDFYLLLFFNILNLLSPSTPNAMTESTTSMTRVHPLIYSGARNSQGQYHGFGNLELPASDQKYDGHFKNGYFHGKGKLTTTTTGSVYDGEFHEGQMQGRGVHTCECHRSTRKYPLSRLLLLAIHVPLLLRHHLLAHSFVHLTHPLHDDYDGSSFSFAARRFQWREVPGGVQRWQGARQRKIRICEREHNRG